MEQILAKYAQRGGSRGWNPTPFNLLRLFIVGPVNSGKTTFVASNPDAYVLDAENRVREVVKGKATYFNLNNIPEYLSLISELCKDGASNNKPCKHVVIDTLDAFCNQAIPFLSETRNNGKDIRDMAQGKGWFILKDFIIGILRDLTLAGYGWTVTGHVREENRYAENEPATTVYRPNIAPSLIADLHQACHLLGSLLKDEAPIYEEQVLAGGKIRRQKEVGRKTRFILSLRSGNGRVVGERYDAKNPYLGYLPDLTELPVSGGWQEFCNTYEAAMKHAREDAAK